MRSKTWKWALGLIYIVTVAAIWIAASYVVQSVVDDGVSPFLLTYICNSLFIIYIPLVEAARFLEDYTGRFCFWRGGESSNLQEFNDTEEVVLLQGNGTREQTDSLSNSMAVKHEDIGQNNGENGVDCSRKSDVSWKKWSEGSQVCEDPGIGLDAKGRWTRTRVAKVSLLICPFWFLAQLTFNLSLKYTSVTSNTILSTASSLFTFLLSLAFLGETFTWLKLIGVLLCMGGTIIVSLGDSESGLSADQSNPVLGDFLALLSSGLYAVYITLIRKKLPDDDAKGQVSMAQFLGFLGFFNLFIFLPIALILNFANLEPFTTLTLKQFGLIVGKGLLDNVLSDYLWAKAVLLTTTTVATAGLTIQVPLAAVVDTITGNAPNMMDYLGAAAVMVGFTGINVPTDGFTKPKESANAELEDENNNGEQHQVLSVTQETTGNS